MGSAIGSALGGNGALTGVASRAALGALGGLGLGLGSVVAFLATMGASYAMAAHESDQFTRALISTGTASTTTTADLRDMAQQVGAQTDSYGKAEKAMLALAQTGAYSREQLGGLTETAVQLAQMTGGDVATSVKFVNTLMGANAKAIAALDMQYHFLTASQLEHIRKLDDEGNADQAQAVAMRAASQAVRDRANEVKESVSIMSKAWSGLTGVVSEAWNAMKQSAGPQTLNMQLATAQKALDAAKGTHFSANSQQLVPNASPAEIAKLQGDVNTLRAQVVQQGIQ